MTVPHNIRSVSVGEKVVLVIIVILSASYVYTTMASKQFYIDEDTYARVGYSLLEGHLASASSLWQIYYHLGYTRSDLYTPFGSAYTVEPWFDHPPLVPLMLVPVLVTGATPRLLPIIFSSLTTLLIFLLLRQQRLLAWVSSIAWTGLFMTHQILSMIFVDAGVAFFNVVTLATTIEYTKTESRKQLYLAGISAGASAASKLFGIATLLYFLAFLVYARVGSRNDGLVKNLKPFLLALAIASVWPIYALATAAPLFIQLQLFNASRSFLSSSSINLPEIAAFNYTKNTMYDAGLDLLLLVGWVGSAYSFRYKILRPIQLSLASYLLVVFALRYAWYYTMIPLLPPLAVGIGVLVSDLILGIRKHFRPRHSRDLGFTPAVP